MFDDFFTRKLLTKLTTIAVESLNSENDNIDALVRKLSENEQDITLIRSYICIQTAAQLTEPLKHSDIDGAFTLLRASEKQLDRAEFAEILDIHRELAEMFWMRRHTPEAEGDAEMETRTSLLRKRLDSLLEGL